MPRIASLLLPLPLLLAAPILAHSQVDPALILNFEAPGATVQEKGWGGGQLGRLFIDREIVRGGEFAGRIEREADSPGEFSTFTLLIPLKFEGDSIQLSGWLRTENVNGFVAIWMRQDAAARPVQFATTQPLGVSGTNDWTEYSITLPVDPSARTVFVGALLAGEGKAWVDDLEILVDGRPLAESPAAPEKAVPFAGDTEFDNGTGIEPQRLSATQVDNLVVLGKVWGFAKYHHPRVTRGEVHWDYELFRILPEVLAAPDRTAATRAIVGWLDRQGELEPCVGCGTLEGDPHLMPEIEWIHDKAPLGPELSRRLELIHQNRPTDGSQYYVSLTPMVGNAVFETEAPYGSLRSGDVGYQLLALFRLWNIIEYWFPYRDLLDEDWDSVLAEFIPQIMDGTDAGAYLSDLLRFVGRIDDTHADVPRAEGLRPPVGEALLPISVRLLKEGAVVTGYLNDDLGPATGLQPGDILLGINGTSVASLVQEWAAYYPASNEAARLRDIGRRFTRGRAGPIRIEVRRGSETLEITAERVSEGKLDLRRGWFHDLPGEAFQRLDEDVAYLKLSSVVAADAGSYIRRAEGAKVLVIDIRNYPSEFVVFALGGHLVEEPTPFARFTHGDLENPGAFMWGDSAVLQPLSPHFKGKVMILVDEASQSQAEYTAMAFRAAPKALVVGSTTAGADGNVSWIPLPGNVSTMISGIGVFYPDRTPTQRVGIIPDLFVRPTAAGIREGRDEVLEAAVSHALGRDWRLTEVRM